MRIKKRNGEIVEVDRGYLMDGETLVVETMMMDSRRSMVTDSRGNPAGCRPGFLYADSKADEAVEAAHRQYRADIEQRWQSDRWQSQPQNAKPSAPQTLLTGDAAVAESYRQYNNDISNRWKHR